jgi:hypothetical protein
MAFRSDYCVLRMSVGIYRYVSRGAVELAGRGRDLATSIIQ